MLFIIGIDKVNSKESGGSYNVLKIREMQKAGGCWVPHMHQLPLLPQRVTADVRVRTAAWKEAVQ